jgi:hypothetical protein
MKIEGGGSSSGENISQDEINKRIFEKYKAKTQGILSGGAEALETEEGKKINDIVKILPAAISDFYGGGNPSEEYIKAFNAHNPGYDLGMILKAMTKAGEAIPTLPKDKEEIQKMAMSILRGIKSRESGERLELENMAKEKEQAEKESDWKTREAEQKLTPKELETQRILDKQEERRRVWEKLKARQKHEQWIEEQKKSGEVSQENKTEVLPRKTPQESLKNNNDSEERSTEDDIILNSEIDKLSPDIVDRMLSIVSHGGLSDEQKAEVFDKIREGKINDILNRWPLINNYN